MRVVCVFTKQHVESIKVADRCVESGKQFGINVEKYPAVYWREMDAIHEKYNLRKKYTPTTGTNTTSATTCPATRMANGTTHYLLYRWSLENKKSICIVEHDAVFVNMIPKAIENGIIQVSSHQDFQMTEEIMADCNRARKMKKFQPDFEYKWDAYNGVIRHPLTGTNGTSGYIIHPGAAKKMVDYVEKDGIAYADRIRTEWIGEGNLYLQVPQSVLCHHDVKSVRLG